MNTSRLLTGVGVFFAVILSVIAVTRHAPQSQPIVVGSATGPDSFFPCETHDGVQTCFSKVAFKSGTSTPVAIKSPSATSTLISAICSYTGNAGAGVTLVMAKATTAFATTTLLAQRGLASPGSLNFPLIASTTPVATAETTQMFPPNNFLVFDMAGILTQSLTGNCSAVFRTI